jgi:hypothetical protein
MIIHFHLRGTKVKQIQKKNTKPKSVLFVLITQFIYFLIYFHLRQSLNPARGGLEGEQITKWALLLLQSWWLLTSRQSSLGPSRKRKGKKWGEERSRTEQSRAREKLAARAAVIRLARGAVSAAAAAWVLLVLAARFCLILRYSSRSGVWRGGLAASLGYHK